MSCLQCVTGFQAVTVLRKPIKTSQGFRAGVLQRLATGSLLAWPRMAGVQP